jgi:hypothetical protein
MRPARLALLALTAGCGGTAAPPTPVSVVLAPEYHVTVVTKIFPDGVGVDRLEVVPLRLFDLQTAGGQVVGSVARADGGPTHPVQGTFEADTGRFRFDAFEGPLISPQPERVEAMGGRGDDDIPADGIANAITGFVRTSSGTTYQTDGAYIGVADAEGLPALDVAKASAQEIEVGRVRLEGAVGFAPNSAGVEVFVYSPRGEQPTFQVESAEPDGRLRPTFLSAVPGDVILMRALVARRLGPAVALKVP